ncbi:MAG: hypothetical protein WC421_11310 [Elusimicrobiales bacterium]
MKGLGIAIAASLFFAGPALAQMGKVVGDEFDGDTEIAQARMSRVMDRMAQEIPLLAADAGVPAHADYDQRPAMPYGTGELSDKADKKDKEKEEDPKPGPDTAYGKLDALYTKGTPDRILPNDLLGWRYGTWYMAAKPDTGYSIMMFACESSSQHYFPDTDTAPVEDKQIYIQLLMLKYNDTRTEPYIHFSTRSATVLINLFNRAPLSDAAVQVRNGVSTVMGEYRFTIRKYGDKFVARVKSPYGDQKPVYEVFGKKTVAPRYAPSIQAGQFGPGADAADSAGGAESDAANPPDA